MNLSRTLLTTATLMLACSAVQCEPPADEGFPVEVPERDDAADTAPALDGDAGPRGDGDARAEAHPEDADPGLPPRDGARFPSDGGPFPARDGEITCPASTPQEGTDCNAMSTCAYDGLICTCPRHGQGDSGRAWSCFRAPVQVDAGTCPAGQPHSHGVCAIEGLNCRYGRVQCFCGGSSNADDAVWDCR